jgi:transposase
VGIDPHKKTHTAVAVDCVTGQVVGQHTVSAEHRGHMALLDWVRGLDSERRFAVEDCRHVSGRLQRALLGAGEVVVRVPPRLMAGARQSTRERGKSDPIDAKAVALAAMREPALPKAHLVEGDLDTKLLLDHREDLVQERSRIQQRLRWHLHELGLESDVPAGALDRGVWVERVSRRLSRHEQTTRVRIAREELKRIRELNRQVYELETEIGKRIKASHSGLLAISGCGVLTAAKIISEVAGVGRFSNEACLAMHAGVAPLECSSGNSQRHRLNRQGNRQLNLALHRIAITQGRYYEPAKLYLKKKEAEGKSRREALRCLKRHLARVVYKNLRNPVTATGLT